jgi:hypothetical protein
MTRHAASAHRLPLRRAGFATLLAGCAIWPAHAADIKFTGRFMAGEVLRVQERDPRLLTGVNAAAIGLSGSGSGGNADDANTNYGRWDAASRAVKGLFELAASEGKWSALVRVKAWHDFGLRDDDRPWGNVANRYAPDAPLEDRGAPRLSRFSGVALQDAWVQGSTELGPARLLARVGQQSLDWGGRALNPGGLEALNPRDLPGLRRAGSVLAEAMLPRPMLFGRASFAQGFGVEAYYQTRFRPTALDMCGTLWSMSDYMVDGCDRVMTGQPAVSDRARQPLGAYQKRLPTPKPESGEFGFGLTWRSAALNTDFGLYHARYTSRTAFPGLRRSTRPTGPALIPGDPDGRNMAYFTEYPEGLRISALNFTHKRGAATWHGEVSYRPETPFMLAPGDVVPPFLSATAPSLLRARANAVPAGGLFHGYDVYGMWQAQLGLRHEASLGKVPLALGFEVVGKHAESLPDQALLRYGRADIFGVGTINGACAVNTGDAARQCSLRGYATANSWGYRMRLDARLPALMPQLATSASALFVHDVKGWSGDFLLNEGRKSLAMALRVEYRQRYLAELAYTPVWGGDYNPAADRDTASFAVGVKW